jgi:hypothetical protein
VLFRELSDHVRRFLKIDTLRRSGLRNDLLNAQLIPLAPRGTADVGEGVRAQRAIGHDRCQGIENRLLCIDRNRTQLAFDPVTLL